MNFRAQESKEKLRGGYYTHADVADFLTRWVLQARPQRLLEPACGNGAFFEALVRRGPSAIESVVGFEINPVEAAKAKVRARALPGVKTDLFVGDFLRGAMTYLFDG